MKGSGAKDCPNSRKVERMAVASAPATVPDLQSPSYSRKRAGDVSASFGAGSLAGYLLRRLAAYHLPVGQAVTVRHPCCLAGESKHMFNMGSSSLWVGGSSHPALPDVLYQRGLAA